MTKKTRALSSAVEILESMDEAFYAIDRDWRFLYVNPGAERFWGRPRAELLGRDMLAVFPRFAGSESHRAHERAIATGERTRIETISTATRRPVELILQPSPSGLSVFFRDITERLQMERQLRERDEVLSLAERSAGIGVWDIELATGKVHGTPQFFRVMGLPPAAETVPIETMRNLRHPDDGDRVVAGYNQAVTGGADAYEAEYRIVRPDTGETRWIFGRGRVIRDLAGNPVRYSGIDIDITERKAAEAALAESRARLDEAVAALAEMNQKLEQRVSERTAELEAEAARRSEAEARLVQAQKMEAVGQLTGGMAHDFNNLLTVILGNLDMLRRRIEAGAAAESPERLLRPVEMAMQGARNAAQLTHRLLAFSRRQPLAPRTFGVNRLVEEMGKMIGRVLGETIEMRADLAPDVGPVFADANQLESALLNLVLNARDAMRDGGRLTLETANVRLDESNAATAEAVAPGDYVMLAVSDTGTGIAPEVVGQVFEPFFTTKETGKGSGLGLSMVYGFVRQSGGHVRIYSEVGHGTTVKIYLPRAGGAISEGPTPPNSGADATDPLLRARPGETILLVEDNDGVRNYGVGALEDLGYRVVAAPDGAAALDVLEGEGIEIDLLFTDIVLPGGMGGQAVAERARTRRPQLPVLYTTGYAPGAVVNGSEAGANFQLLGKPYTLDGLARKVRQVIDGGAGKS